jgi:septal ring factor EnvC (AmiA/AmiB activator)
LTTELERIKILEGKISQVVNYLNKTIAENERLKQQVKELKMENKDLAENGKKMELLSESVKNYETEREAIKNKIEELINQIDQIGI